MSAMTTPTSSPPSGVGAASVIDVRRIAVGLALAVTAAIHVLDLPGKIEEVPYLAVAYVLLIVAATVIMERIFRGGVLID